jgi:hypothetical protein
LAFSTISANAQTDYVWTGDAGGNWYDAGNWASGNVPTDGTLLRTASSDDTVTFDSESASSMPGAVTTYQGWTGSLKMPQVRVLNGTVNFSGTQNWGWSGIDTFVIGDGDTVTPAAISVSFSGLNRDPNGIKTYIVKVDGTFNVNASITSWSYDVYKDTVVKLQGGTMLVNGTITEGSLTGDAGDYVAFEAVGSSFTAQFGASGSFIDLAAVQAEIGDSKSFRINGTGLDKDVFIDAVDNQNGTFSLTLVDPPPSGTVITIK